MSDLSLSQWLQEPVEHRVAASLFVLKEVAEALDAAHGTNKLHGNLSPAQIRVRIDDAVENGQILSAQPTGFGRESPVQNNLDIGTPPPEAAYYFAPEKILGSRITGQSDQFSLAVIAYEMLCGMRPFDAPNLPALFHRICTKQPEPQCESLEPAVHRILNRGMAKNPEDRFASCTSFLEALQTALGEPVRSAANAAGLRSNERPSFPNERFGTMSAGTAGAAVGTVRGAYLHRDDGSIADPLPRNAGSFERSENMAASRFDDDDEPDWTPGARRNRHVHNPIDEMADLADDPRLAGPFKRNRAWLIPLFVTVALAVAVFVLQPYLPWQKWQAAITGETPSTTTSSTATSAARSEPPSTPSPSIDSSNSASEGDRSLATPGDSETPKQFDDRETASNTQPSPDRSSATKSAEDHSLDAPSSAAPAMPSAAARSRSATPETPDGRSDGETPTPYRAGASSLPTYTPRTSRAPEADPLAVTSVELFTTPPGSRIIVDGRPDIGCQSPCSLSLTSGRHTLTAEQDGFTVARRIFNVPQDRSLFIPLTKGIGTLVLSSQPPGSTVTIDGKPAGITPFTIRLSSGSHRVDMVKGSQHHQESIEIQADALQTRAFTW